MTEKKRTPKKIEVSLSDLIDAGILKAGATFTASYKGEKYTARLTKSGTLKYGKDEYNSLSMLGRAILAAAGVEKPSVNGWAFFTAKVGGETVTVGSLREKVSV